MTTATAPYDPPVGRWKRPKLPALDGTGTDTYVRGSTLTGTLDDSSALDTWKTRQLVRAARSARLTDDLSAADLLDADEPEVDPSTLRDYLDAPRESVPVPYRAYVDAFYDALDAAGLTLDPEYTNAWLMHTATGSVTRVWRVVVAADGITRAPLILRTSVTTSHGSTQDGISAVLVADATHRLNANHDGWDAVSPLFPHTAVLMHLPTKTETPTATLSTLDLDAARLNLDTALAVRAARADAKHTVVGRRVRVYADGTVET
ncbi:Uncharacterised protein [Mycobacteroides abscessus subsp. abscessus]|uniref:hypothetical protein n=1 Tax=Mycobacteroides abscessus TaxID=36809 RepID=UPI00092689F4|nr:hypothetical protein [Mycobacteroides abscessus]SIC64476.1 Uncharacterised protein [Mycobacteroides abscessus subsp. abscessus]SIG65487.1 Uncharacterised protein [Mycobacteroides abscessus subsp. abscessus]